MNKRRIAAFIIGLLMFFLLFILFRTQLVANLSTGSLASENSDQNEFESTSEFTSQVTQSSNQLTSQDIRIQISPKLSIKNTFNLRVYSEIRFIASKIYSDTMECINSGAVTGLSINECTEKVLSLPEYNRHNIAINEACETEAERQMYGQYQTNIFKYCIINLQSQYNRWYYLRYNGESWIYDKPYYYFALEYPSQ